MLWLVVAGVIGLLILFALMRFRRTQGLESLGTVSQSWIANERAASRNEPH
jgi:hypothetical protein